VWLEKAPSAGRWNWMEPARITASSERSGAVGTIVRDFSIAPAAAGHLEGIIGAFLAGLALNRAVHESPAKHELAFLGHTLFIPMFFITVGFLIDVRVFATTLASHLGLVVGIVGGLIVSKLLAAVLTQRAFNYSRQQGLVMWSLSLPQVAATLAASLVAYEAQDANGRRLIDEPALNTVIVLMVVTSILGPILTEQFGKRLKTAGQISARSSSEVAVASV
jgi:Kef-type K+ transport system membrane component KefB